MSAASRLPEELLREILTYLLTTDEETFCEFRRRGLRLRGREYGTLVAHYPASKTAPLLVSQQWLRIGTPILYEKLRVFEASRTKIVAQLVKANPAVGRAIRYLRLEGGMGRDLLTIVKHAPNIHTIWIALNLRGSESIAGLKKAVSLLQPRNLYITGTTYRMTKASEEVGKLVASSISDIWTSLTSVVFHDHSRVDSKFCYALRDAPALRQISMGTDWSFEWWLDEGGFANIVKNKTLGSFALIRLHGDRDVEATLKKAAEACGLVEREVNLFNFTEEPERSVWWSPWSRPSLFSGTYNPVSDSDSDDESTSTHSSEESEL